MQLVSLFCGGFILKLKAILPTNKQMLSLFDYLQSFFVDGKNLLVNMGNQNDVISETTESDAVIDHMTVQQMGTFMQQRTSLILSNMLTMPSMYPNSYIYGVLQLEKSVFKTYMRSITISNVILKMCQDAYNLALQADEIKDVQMHQLMDPLTRRALVNQFANDVTTKQVQLLFKQAFSLAFVHPHPFINITKSDLQQTPVFEAFLFDAKFIVPLMMTARWMTLSCMRKETHISNNNSHLLLYGSSGAGKSLILSALSSAVPTYRFLVNNKYQNPEVLTSAFIFIDEFDTSNLVNNLYKALLDIKAPVKSDFKNLHPENISEDVPFLLSSNDDFYSTLQALPQKRVNLFGCITQVSQSSVDAAIRRIYAIPLKMGKYDKLHGNVNKSCKYYDHLNKYNNIFENQTKKLDKLFNFMFAFGLHQRDIKNMYLNYEQCDYAQAMIRQFQQTLFGQMYLKRQGDIDNIIQQIEEKMLHPDLNDRDMQNQMQVAADDLHSLMKQFMKENSSHSNMEDLWEVEFVKTVIKDNVRDVPWPIKVYFSMDKGGLKAINGNNKCIDPSIDKHLNSYINSYVIDGRNHSTDQLLVDQLDIEAADEEEEKVSDPLIGKRVINDVEIDSLFLDTILSINDSNNDVPSESQEAHIDNEDETMYARLIKRKHK